MKGVENTKIYSIKGFKVATEEKQYWNWKCKRKIMQQMKVVISKWDG